jgi:plasmid stabilization system protein ParE
MSVTTVHNPPAAARIAAELVDRIKRLPDFPEMGAPRARRSL